MGQHVQKRDTRVAGKPERCFIPEAQLAFLVECQKRLRGEGFTEATEHRGHHCLYRLTLLCAVGACERRLAVSGHREDEARNTRLVEGTAEALVELRQWLVGAMHQQASRGKANRLPVGRVRAPHARQTRAPP